MVAAHNKHDLTSINASFVPTQEAVLRRSERPLFAHSDVSSSIRDLDLYAQINWTSRVTEAVMSACPECIRGCRPDLRALLSSRTKPVPATKAGDTHDQ
jgi:hypothetical protein